MTSSDLPERLREAAKTIPMPDGEYAQHLMRTAADELEEWRAVDHNPPPFDENGVLNDTDARAQDDRRESLLRAIHDITRPEYPPENAAMIVAETHRLTSDLLKVPDSTDAKAQHKLELNRRGWDYDEAQGGFVRIAEGAEPSLEGLPVGPHAYRLRLAAERAARERAAFPWPLVPMRQQHDSDEAYTRAMVAWGKAVHEIERNRET